MKVKKVLIMIFIVTALINIVLSVMCKNWQSFFVWGCAAFYASFYYSKI